MAISQELSLERYCKKDYCNGFAISYIYYFLADVETREHPAGAFGAVGFDSVLLQLSRKVFSRSISAYICT